MCKAIHYPSMTSPSRAKWPYLRGAKELVSIYIKSEIIISSLIYLEAIFTEADNQSNWTNQSGQTRHRWQISPEPGTKTISELY